MNQPTAAQQAQQRNRDAAGRYAEKDQSDPGANVLDPDAQLGADLVAVLARAERAHDSGDQEALEAVDFDLPEVLSALADRYGDDPAFTEVMAKYRTWRVDFQAQVDAGDEGGDADLADRAEDVANAFADKLMPTAVPPSAYQRWLAAPAFRYGFSRSFATSTIFSYGYLPRPLQPDTRVSMLYRLAKQIGDGIGTETPLPHLPAAGQLAQVERPGEFGDWVAGEAEAETWRTVENSEDPEALTNGDYLADVHRRLCTLLTGGM